jgi:hypothetical protein
MPFSNRDLQEPTHDGLLRALNVLTNEKRGGLKLVSFDWSGFKLFTL